MFERHGLSNTPEYSVWHGIKDRCLNPNSCNWSRYGGRGITICDRWKDSFPNFLEDMGKRPSDQHSIERKNNDGNYEPSNCIWATVEQQVYNRSTNVYVKLSDSDDFIDTKKAMKLLNMRKGTFFTRLYRNTDLTKPIRRHETTYEYNGQTYSLKELAKLSKVKAKDLARRIREGMKIEDAINKPKCEVRKYSYKGQELTIPEISKLENIRPESIRYGINRGLDIDDAIEFIKRNNIQVIDNESGKLISVKTNLNKRHGETNTIEYLTWAGLKAVCYNPRNPDYKYYGAKGTTMCDKWRFSYLDFVRDVGRRPTPEHSLKVLDKTKPIDIGNVEWRLRDKNYIEKKALVITLKDGRRIFVNEAAEILKLGRSTIYNRIKQGISIADLIEEASKK